MKELELKVEGMHCSGCENRIKNALDDIDGIKKVEASYETGIVKVVFKKEIDIEEVKNKIKALDFEIVE